MEKQNNQKSIEQQLTDMSKRISILRAIIELLSDQLIRHLDEHERKEEALPTIR